MPLLWPLTKLVFTLPPVLKEPDQDQVLTGSPPFTRRENIELACKIVLEDERPFRPTDSGKLGLTDEVWGTLQRCWEKEPSAQPSIDEVPAYLRSAMENWVVDVLAFMLATKVGIERVVNLKEEQARISQTGLMRCVLARFVHTL